MKIILILATLLLSSLFANYANSASNSQKIDMHGGNSDSLIGNKNSLSNMNSKNLNNIGIEKEKKKFKVSKETPTEKDEEKNLKDLEDLGL
ncbi:conserved hypothetical protein [Arcobacter nitrofigilis DSM 7299]|uniref:Uncharacterized protein n=1 Tax=Arcobacter nitrofigilis (strain ATCC 33309 / DSM 7299 / CCUG 15893 / LMG 7604 / NCTC 12251 / CI) TaxID=572480 RepID=D5V3Y6_ARCNC|nr:hypothetical protein [Arcobacter nitrofigilis]ADG92814.1 conserved hypothetical protein [Arcobacter nitrofigilis DSM 7299]